MLLLRPIIDYHGPLFHWLHLLVSRVGVTGAMWLWKVGVVAWLTMVGRLALTRRFTPLFTAIVLTGVVLLRLPGLGLVEQNADESQWIASAATLVEDPRFWLSVDGTTSGPLNVMPPALLYYLGLSLDYTTLRLWGLLTCVLPTVGLLLATFRRRFGERTARLAILPVACCLALVTDPDAVAFNSEQLPMMLLALSGYVLSRIFSIPTSGQIGARGWLPVLGVVLGCLPYTKLQSTPIGLAIAIWVLAGLLTENSTHSPGRWWRAGGFVAGGLLPTLLIGGYLLATNLTDYAFRSYILTNLDYAQVGSWGAGRVTWADRLLTRLPRIYGGMSTTNWFWRLAFLLGVVVLLLSRFRPRPQGRPTLDRWFAASICVVGFYATVQPGNPFQHYQWLSFVPVSWLIAQFVHRLLTVRESGLNRPVTGAIGVGYGLLTVVFPGWLALSRPNPGIDQLASGGWHSATWEVSEALKPYARPGDTLVIWGWANSLHVETGLLMGSRFIPLYFPVVPGPQQAYFLTVYRDDLLRNRPTFIVDILRLNGGGNYAPYPIKRYPAIQQILDTRYTLIKIVDGVRIYALRQRGQDFSYVHHAHR